MHKTCYVTRIRDWSSDVCSSDLVEDGEVDGAEAHLLDGVRLVAEHAGVAGLAGQPAVRFLGDGGGEVLHAKGNRVVRHVDVPAAPFGLGAAGEQEADGRRGGRSEEHTSELQSLMRISYAVFCLQKNSKKKTTKQKIQSKHKLKTKDT